MNFEIVESGNPKWNTLFARLPRDAQDIFYTSQFANLCQHTLNELHRVKCATYSSSDGAVLLYPFVYRQLSDFLCENYASGLADTISLYGRGGIVGSANNQDLDHFHEELTSYMNDEHVFCSFDRFHPIMRNEKLAPRGSLNRQIGGFVVVTLRESIQALEASFKASVRKDLRKAERNDVKCFAEKNCNHIADFFEIYYQTMDRNLASNFYYFPKEFFTKLPELMPDNFHFFYAEHDNRIVSCELVLHHGDYAHSFLGGTRTESLPLASNTLLKFEILKKMTAMNYKYFLLGGGLAGDDGIFNFKKAYAPGGVLPSLVGGTVWQPVIYDELRQAMQRQGAVMADQRFQFYDRS